ncbi:MAG: NADH-quinone oxidoreductase subunit L [Chitinophagales bacterium]|nr:NADH-quinone oxidoreductase subunit L [Chitinophagales bacterium]
MSHYSYATLIPLLPLAGFILLGLFGRKYFSKSSGVIATFLLLISALLSLYIAYQYFFVAEKVKETYETIVPLKYTWLQFTSAALQKPGSPNDLSIDMGILLDPISVMMMVVITFISLMVHIYSLGYMKKEERFSTYYAFLSLFTFSMLGLVISSNIFQIYIFWELVGISSYLLIGFYYDRPAAVAASKKAFIVTRFADLGFLIGILILSFYSGSLDFQTIIQRLTTPSPQLSNIITVSFLGFSALSWGLVLIFIGGAGKSAMFPLHIWLPDAMEGPTPVSALIHAATMVVAGVFLVARMFPVFVISDPAALEVVAFTGIFSAFLAAIIACTQTDIKRVLAFSTMSQIGFMMFALGVSGYSGGHGAGYTASMFHLFTHAFFKSSLFLCAGIVIHAVHSNQVKDMGGLRKSMPVTHAAFLIACLAISGIPPFAGFFSKEEILYAAYQSNRLIYTIGLITSGITAFYMFRLYFSIFWNKEANTHSELISESLSNNSSENRHSSEGTFSMKLPLVILSVCTLLAGFVPFSGFVSSDGQLFHSVVPFSFSVAPVLLSVTGIFIAYLLYRKENGRPQKIANSLGNIYQAIYHKFYIDEAYLFITKKILFNLIGKSSAWTDRNVVDRTMNSIATGTGKFSLAIRKLQSGNVQEYALYFFGGIAVMIVIFVYWWK